MRLKLLALALTAVIIITISLLYSINPSSVSNVNQSSTTAIKQIPATSTAQQPTDFDFTVTVRTTGTRWTVTPKTRAVIEVLEPSIEKATVKLLNCSSSARITHVATFTEGGVNYTILEVTEPSSNITTTYYVSWRSVSGLKVLDYGKVGFEVVASGGSGWVVKLNTTNVYVGGVPGRLEVPERGGYTVMRPVNVPEVLEKVYLVTVYDVGVIKLNSEVIANATAAGRFYVDYENMVLWVDDLSSEWHDPSKAEVLEFKRVAKVKPSPISKGEAGGVSTYVKYELAAQYVNGMKVTKELTPNVLVMPWLIVSVSTPPIVATQVK